MPIEIRELHIKAVINQGRQTTSGNAPNAASGAEETPDKEDIVAECVEKVLTILRDKLER